MYMLEGCYGNCGWAAYAYVDHWNSVYQGNYYYMTGVQMHEIGHNFNLAHSGGLDGQTYTDHTGFMVGIDKHLQLSFIPPYTDSNFIFASLNLGQSPLFG